ncbi:MAG: hypothetical protein ABJA94_04320 [Rhodoglobus sp.]
MTTLTPLPGDPTALRTYSDRYGNIADAILATSRRLRSFADEIAGEGKSVTQLAERSAAAGTAILKAHPRYETTANALGEYSVRLHDAQDSAIAAISHHNGAENQLPWYLHRRQQLQDDFELEMLMPSTPSKIPDINHDRTVIGHQIAEIEGSAATAIADYQRAVVYRDTAAKSAIEAITPVLGAMNDTVGDYVDAWVNSLPDFMQAIGRWLGDIFVAVVESLQHFVDQFVAAVTYIWTVIVMIPEIMANLPLEFWIAAIIAPGLVLPLIGGLSTLIAARIAKEPLRPTPKMTEVDRTDLEKPSSSQNPYATAMGVDVDLDAAGAENSTVVQIVEVLDANGNRVGWRVTLPSTQDWQEADPFFGGTKPEGDRGAMNDLDSNLALMLTPSQQAAYQRAVIQAMLTAGIGPDDPVMLIGWSQGGILAGRMASDPSSPFNIQALYVSGAPIDAMRIPDSVSVISVQHTGEPVASLDGPIFAQGHEGNNWTTITVDQQNDPNTGKPPVIDGSERSPHDGDAYTETAAIYVDGSTDPKVQAIKAEQAMFFSNNEHVHVYEGAEKPVPLLSTDPMLGAAA